ncbi:RDD family protein [Truepera radiovictrix]|uniref:RDD domain containing protein n=1 Tax=Truepera radiovictrix (strain DSM 17093 / CIP 108686 / LMG 22925 / RQ-24) TaxID=649638 RepID=D7CQC2_TRURR|nr:RDD family protein [Truepera radiovictrix]ADI14906.1 RDD domain containing protein [Truepera radiovictrix DSM 17093]WMT56542.1 RDD family protein [Truepera radiovictrix]
MPCLYPKTSVSPSVRQTLAGIGERLIALILDGLLLGVVSGLLFRSDSRLGGALGFALGLAYQWYFLTRHQGQTPGKMLLNLRVVKVDGGALTDADAVLRYLGYVLNGLAFGLGWLWALFDANRQGWHDKLADTFVVKVGETLGVVGTEGTQAGAAEPLSAPLSTPKPDGEVSDDG